MIGTPPNLVAAHILEEHGVEVPFEKWLGVGIPASLTVAFVAYCALRYFFRPSMPKTACDEELACQQQVDGDEGAMKSKGSKWSWGEKVVLASFMCTLTLWLFPAFYNLCCGPNSDIVKKKMSAGTAVVLGTLPLFLLRKDQHNRVLPWSSAKTADWGIIMLVGGGMLLGKAMLQSGLADVLAKGLVEVTHIRDIRALEFVFILFTVFVTEITSNTATTSMLAPVVIAACKTIDPDPNSMIKPVVGIALSASCAFMMPMATAPNYIVKDTGHVSLGEMAKVGICINLICAVLIWSLLQILVPLVWAVRF